MTIRLISEGPAHQAIHVDFSGGIPTPANGAILTLVDPDAILAAARAGRQRADWVIWRLETLPWPEKRAAAFAVELGKRVRGCVFVVLDESLGRSVRIAGHLLCAGCERDDAALSLGS